MEQTELFLNITKYLVAGSSDKDLYKNHLEQRKIRKDPFKTPVIIVAGGASLMAATKTEQYRECIREMMHGFKGTIISGGTTAGIPGLVGEVKMDLEKKGSLDFSLIAYLPKKIPAGAVRSLAYDHFYETDAGHFSILEVLSYWCDLVCQGISPADIVLIGIEGGDIAAMEYQIALKLGAKVGLVAGSGRAASGLLQDDTWKNHRNLFALPNNRQSILDFVNQFRKSKIE